MGREIVEVGVRGCDEDEFIAHEGLRVYPALKRGTFDESDGNFAGEKESDHLFGVAALQRELHVRMIGEKCADEPGQHVLRDGGGDAESESAGKFSVGGAEFLLGLGSQRGNFLSVAQEDGALRSEGNAMAGAVEEADAEIVLEGFDLQRDCGLAEKKMFRGFAEVEMLGSGSKNLESKIF